MKLRFPRLAITKVIIVYITINPKGHIITLRDSNHSLRPSGEILLYQGVLQRDTSQQWSYCSYNISQPTPTHHDRACPQVP